MSPIGVAVSGSWVYVDLWAYKVPRDLGGLLAVFISSSMALRRSVMLKCFRGGAAANSIQALANAAIARLLFCGSRAYAQCSLDIRRS